MKGTVVSMTLSTQESKKTKCEHGVNFGYEGCRVWVDKGARGWFKVKYVKQEATQGKRTYCVSRSASWVGSHLVNQSVGRSVSQLVSLSRLALSVNLASQTVFS